ncbi:MAG TPA: hypothetical protein VFW87_13395 [Pirellulales bacterium]|nr:hypothetical protein [Pirellulales bacterium]
MRKVNLRIAAGALSALALAIAATSNSYAAPAATLKAGDEAVVSENGTPLKIGNDTLATLSRGQRFKVIEIKGPWVGGRLSVDGQERAGWVWSERALTPQQFAAQPRRIRRYSFDPSERLAQPRATFSRGSASPSSSSEPFVMGATPYGPRYWRADRKISGY